MAELREQLNALVFKPVVEEVIEAFLIYAHHVGEFFRIGTFLQRYRIIVNRVGFETWEENPIRGLPRKFPASEAREPANFNHLERALIAFQPKFGPGNVRRRSQSLLITINEVLGSNRIDEGTFIWYMQYMSLIRQYFVYEDRYEQSLSVFRLDSADSIKQ